MTVTDTREIIMAAARPMVQAGGYNALSFRDVATQVGVKSASVHYHFPTKRDLGAALAVRYAEEAEALLAGLSLEPSELSRTIDSYLGVFRAALANGNRMCLYGIMAAEYDGLPPEVRDQIDRFAKVNVAWLSKVLAHWTPDAGAELIREQALAIFAAVEGAQLVARSRGDIAVFDRCVGAYRAAGLLP